MLLVNGRRTSVPDLASFLFEVSEMNIRICCSHYVHDSPPRTLSVSFVGLTIFGSLAILWYEAMATLQASTAEDGGALHRPPVFKE